MVRTVRRSLAIAAATCAALAATVVAGGPAAADTPDQVHYIADIDQRTFMTATAFSRDVTMRQRTGSDEQRWRLAESAAGVLMVNVRTGACAQPEPVWPGINAPLVQERCGNVRAQYWRLITDSTRAVVTFQNVESGRCIEADPNSTGASRALYVTACNRWDRNQQFRLLPG